jgi:hypothetical protein
MMKDKKEFIFVLCVCLFLFLLSTMVAEKNTTNSSVTTVVEPLDVPSSVSFSATINEDTDEPFDILFSDDVVETGPIDLVNDNTRIHPFELSWALVDYYSDNTQTVTVRKFNEKVGDIILAGYGNKYGHPKRRSYEGEAGK